MNHIENRQMQASSSQTHRHWGESMSWGRPQVTTIASSQQEKQHFPFCAAPRAQPALVNGSCNVIHLVVPSSRQKVTNFLLKMSNHFSFCYELSTAHSPLKWLVTSQGTISENLISPTSSECISCLNVWCLLCYRSLQIYRPRWLVFILWL